VLVVLERTGPAPDPGLRALVHGAFAHRRKALPRSLELATGDREVRERARTALRALGQPDDVRAERLTPGDFAALWERLR
jgi:16S rRNA (adenine1518-N6/adenine1519-N6)-dimethyltransferase